MKEMPFERRKNRSARQSSQMSGRGRVRTARLGIGL